MGCICLKTKFLQLKHYIHQIYLTLLSTTCVKIHLIPCVLFETITHFSRHNSSTFFQFKHYILLTKISHQSTNFKIFLLLKLKLIKLLVSFFKERVGFSLNFGSLFSIMRDNSSVLFQLKLYMIWTKGAHQSAKFQTFDCSRKISPNLYFDRLLKVYKILAKKYRGVISHDPED